MYVELAMVMSIRDSTVESDMGTFVCGGAVCNKRLPFLESRLGLVQRVYG